MHPLDLLCFQQQKDFIKRITKHIFYRESNIFAHAWKYIKSDFEPILISNIPMFKYAFKGEFDVLYMEFKGLRHNFF